MTESAVTAESPGFRGRLQPLISGSIGNVVEWYDWSVYGLLAVVFAPQIFTSRSAIGSLIEALITFAIGFFFRPLGALVLSPLADRLGRQRMLSYTILFMGASSLLLVVTPGASVIGIWAAVLFLVARIVQGLSAGGEFQTSISYLVEHAPPGRRGLTGSIGLMGTVGSALVGTLVVTLTTLIIPSAAMASWGWRIPFLIGALVAAYGFYIRLRSPETPAFQQLEEKREVDRNPLRTIFTQRPFNLVRVLSLQILTVAFYLWTIFLPTVGHLLSGLPLAEGLVASTIAQIILVALLPVVGHLSDSWGRKPFLIAAAIGFIVLPVPAFLLLEINNIVTYAIVAILGCGLLACIDGVMGAYYSELFPAQVRTTGIGLPYAITSAIFGGTASLIFAYLISIKFPLGIAFYVMAIAIFCLCIYVFATPETRTRRLAESYRDMDPESGGQTEPRPRGPEVVP